MATIGATDRQAEPVVKLRHPGRWVTYAIAVVLAAMLINTLLTNDKYGWNVVGHYILSGDILSGLGKTIELTVIAMAIGVALGVLLAVMRLSENPAAKGFASLYVWFFRGTPVFVQLLFWGYASALYPRLGLGIPFGPEFVSASTNSLITPFAAAILGLGLNEGAYMAEIVRAGILSVDRGQTEAAQALGMSGLRTLRRIVLPQAMRVIIPPTGNQVITMLKTTSLVSVLAFPELLYSAQLIYSTNFQTIPLLITASLWYLLMTSVLNVGQHFLERRFSRSDRAATGRAAAESRIRSALQRPEGK
nr:amino acid ABC transporter permease [Streptomyces sp. NBC_00886]